jgi:hypothetical protein
MMFKAVSIGDASRFLVRKEKLLKLKSRALRRGVWFRVLSAIDRALVNLTIRVVDEIRSVRLAEKLCLVVEKLENALKNKILHVLKTVGIPLARKLSFLAQKWGNASARKWASEISFAKFLAIIHLNNPPLFKP